MTGSIECSTYHLTDFSIEEYDPLAAINVQSMPSNLVKVDIFSPLSMASTTPASLMIIFAICLGILIP